MSSGVTGPSSGWGRNCLIFFLQQLSGTLYLGNTCGHVGSGSTCATLILTKNSGHLSPPEINFPISRCSEQPATPSKHSITFCGCLPTYSHLLTKALFTLLSPSANVCVSKKAKNPIGLGHASIPGSGPESSMNRYLVNMYGLNK